MVLRWVFIGFLALQGLSAAAWFWSALGTAALQASPTQNLGAIWSPTGNVSAWFSPFVLGATFLLLLCGVAMIAGGAASNRGTRARALLCAFSAAALFLLVSMYHASHAPFQFGGGSYGAGVVMFLGFHGFYATLGLLGLAFCLLVVWRGWLVDHQSAVIAGTAWCWVLLEAMWLCLLVIIGLGLI